MWTHYTMVCGVTTLTLKIILNLQLTWRTLITLTFWLGVEAYSTDLVGFQEFFLLIKILVCKVGAEGKILARSSLICHMVVSTGKKTQLQISPTLSVLVGGLKKVFVRVKVSFSCRHTSLGILSDPQTFSQKRSKIWAFFVRSLGLLHWSFLRRNFEAPHVHFFQINLNILKLVEMMRRREYGDCLQMMSVFQQSSIL